MPKICFPSEGNVSGIEIAYTRSVKDLYFYGWYDTFVGIEGGKIKLECFLKELGITLKDCQKALGSSK